MKVLIVPIHAGHEMFEARTGDIALICLKEASSCLEKIIAEAKALKNKWGVSVTLSTYDSLMVLDSDVIENVVTDLKFDRIMAKINKGEPIVSGMTVNQVLEIEQEQESIECIELHVSDTDVWWEFFPRNTDMTYMTGRVPIKKFARPKVKAVK
jgi:hypothetical protein